MKKFNDLKIRTRLSIILGFVIFLIISISGIYSYTLNKERTINATNTEMYSQLQDMNYLINTQLNDNKKRLDYSVKYAHEIFYEGNYKRKNPLFANVLLNRNNNSSDNYGKVKIYDKTYNVSYELVDRIKKITGTEATIFQKMPEGYIRIATTIKDEYGKRQINTYLENKNNLLQTVDRGKTYSGINDILGKDYLSLYEPIKINGKVEGILFVGLLANNFSELKTIFSEKSFYEDGYPFLMASSGKMLLHPSLEGESVVDYNFYKQIISSNKDKGSFNYLWPENENGKQKVLYYQYLESIDAYVGVTYDYETWYKYLKNIKLSSMLFELAEIIILIIVLVLVLKNLINSLRKGIDFAGKVADGDLTATLEINQQDEIGMLGNSLNRMVTKLQEIVEGVNVGVRNIASASQQMSSGSQQLSQGASEQASSVEEVSSSMEEMLANIQQNTDNSKETEKISNEASKGIFEVSKLSNESLASIRKIADKIGIINDIAFQTNILALNAAVEAARAGEHGKGFAVVAAEVRKLAEKSKNAAEEIVELTQNGVEVTEKGGDLMIKVIPNVEKTSSLVQEISGASMEQRTGSDQINNAIQQLNQVTQQNAASSEELATSSEELSGQAEILSEQIAYFRVDKNSETNTNKKIVDKVENKEKKKNSISNEQTTTKEQANSKGVDLEMYDNDNKLDDEFEKF